MGHYLIKTSPRIYGISYTFFPMNKQNAIPNDCDKHHLDISDKDAVLNTVRRIKPDCVIHTASIANVDYVEKNKEEAKKVNLNGTANIIEACLEADAKLIYISSNAVFDGQKPPYSENDPLNPINYYGQLKVAEEELVRRSGLKYAIVRAILMYGWNLPVERKNPVTWLIEILEVGKEINIVDDIYCNPLFVNDCCEVIWKIVALNKEGTFHVGGRDEISRYEFACLTAETFGLDVNLINPVKNSFFKDLASRPQNTTYCIDKIKKELGVFPLGVREALEIMKRSDQAGRVKQPTI